jgi:hypothetical protein
MSRSNNTEIINPAVRFFEWSGEEGLVKYYDKEKKEQIKLGLPFQFLVLDALSTISGYSDADKSGYWSNEIRDLKTELFVVRTKKGKQFEGTYAQLPSAGLVGVKYAQSVYIAFKDENGISQIGNIKMMGSSLGAWIDFRKKAKIFDLAITITGSVKAKKGSTVYFVPTFETSEPSSNDNSIAVDLDKELQIYLKAYFAKNKESHTEEMVAEQDLGKAIEAAHEKLYGEPNKPEIVDLPYDDDLVF